jgi:hypothetical protein
MSESFVSCRVSSQSSHTKMQSQHVCARGLPRPHAHVLPVRGTIPTASTPVVRSSKSRRLIVPSDLACSIDTAHLCRSRAISQPPLTDTEQPLRISHRQIGSQPRTIVDALLHGGHLPVIPRTVLHRQMRIACVREDALLSRSIRTRRSGRRARDWQPPVAPYMLC